MAQIKLLKIAADGVPVEFGTSDDITLNSFTSGSVVMSATGLAMATQAIVNSGNLTFASASANGITQTAGLLAADNIMAKERENLMTVAGGVSFPVITDVAGQVDSFRLPALAGIPTASPTTAGTGHVVWDSTDSRMYAWNGTTWVDQTTVSTTLSTQTPYIAAATIAARDVVYISAADSVSSATASASGTAQAVGFAVAGAAAAGAVAVQDTGALLGFAGLTAGARYYLSGTTPGAVTATIPTTTGHTIVQVGYAKSATAMHIHIEQMGRRA